MAWLPQVTAQDKRIVKTVGEKKDTNTQRKKRSKTYK